MSEYTLEVVAIRDRDEVPTPEALDRTFSSIATFNEVVRDTPHKTRKAWAGLTFVLVYLTQGRFQFCARVDVRADGHAYRVDTRDARTLEEVERALMVGVRKGARRPHAPAGTRVT